MGSPRLRAVSKPPHKPAKGLFDFKLMAPAPHGQRGVHYHPDSRYEYLQVKCKLGCGRGHAQAHSFLQGPILAVTWVGFPSDKVFADRYFIFAERGYTQLPRWAVDEALSMLSGAPRAL